MWPWRNWSSSATLVAMGAGFDSRTGLEELNYQECLGLLRRSCLGRLAVVLDAQPLVFPVNFTLDDTAVVFRTNEGNKILAAREHDVAFECDDIDRTYHTGWSVLVTGRAEQVLDPTEIARFTQLPLTPWSQGPKPIWMRVAPRTITGRRIPLHGDTTPQTI
jgi:uncharacterized protein